MPQTTRETPSFSAQDYQWPADEYYVSERYRAVYCPIPKVACSSLKLWWADVHRGGHDQFVGQDERKFPVILHEELDREFRLFAALPSLGREPLKSEDWFRFVFVRNPWSRLVSAFLNKFVASQPQAEPVYQHFHNRWRPDAWQRLLRPRAFFGSSNRSDGPRDPFGPLLRGAVGWREHFTFRHFVDYLTTVELNDFGEVPVDIHWMPQWRFLGLTKFHFVGRLESFQDDFRHVREHLNIKETPADYNRSTYAAPSRQFEVNVADWPLSRLRRMERCPHYRSFYTPQLAQIVGDLYRRDVEQFGYDF